MIVLHLLPILSAGAARAVEQCEETGGADEADSGSLAGHRSGHHPKKAGHF